MDPSKTKAADELKRQFPQLTLAEAYAIVERHKFNVEAAIREMRSTFVASAGDHGVMYDAPSATAGPESVKNAMDELFQQQRKDGEGENQAFFGSGRRLGHTEAPSPVIPAAVRQQRTVTVTVYANEIRVDGGIDVPVKSIPLGSPEAKSFMDSMRSGLVPPSLDAIYPNCELNVELQDRTDREYQPPVGRFEAFQDEGRRLGGSCPTASGAAATGSSSSRGMTDLCYDPSRIFAFDDSQESTVVRLVNTKGGQTELKVNPAVHTVEDLYFLAHEIEPDRRQFVLEARDMPPRKLGPETRSQTIEQAKLKRAVVVIRPL